MKKTALLRVNGWRYAKCGPPGEVLKSETWAGATVGESDVKVKMSGVPVLKQDVDMLMGTYGGYKAENTGNSPVAGTEGWGMVVEAGPKASVSKGSKVAITTQNVGTWASEVTTSDANITDVTGLKISNENLALLSVYSSAVLLASEYGDVRNATCWVLGAETPVGQALAPLLQSKGATVTALKQGEKQPQGSPKFIFNAVGGEDLRAATDAAAEGCTVVTWDNISKQRMDIAGTKAVMSGMQIRSFWFNRWLQQSTPAQRTALFEEAAALSQSTTVAQAPHNFSNFAAAFDSVYVSPAVPVVSF